MFHTASMHFQRFSFWLRPFLQSPKAIVFHDKVELTAHRFLATVYGRSQDMIDVVLIIYGHRK